FDTYRLASSGAFQDLGVDEYFAGTGVCFVEWADKVADVLPADHLRIEIETTGETGRRFRVTAAGPQGERVLARLAQLYSERGTN
ncbi:MAG: tRNA (adenosine(37)-N6)-threonylcarbamoyltransferase complex ATPase subunit type 1 TsaE, partial [Planctomycetota bacterium]|nr:tRNA (adenosine(37)-N6)-threonylcarbamoyltransferase complex ATPase subunit type 1 TsaE [Planctomycetota bacterium]